jgi:hypothetical protein
MAVRKNNQTETDMSNFEMPEMSEAETVEAFNLDEFEKLSTDFLIEGLLMFREQLNTDQPWGGLDETETARMDKLVRELTSRGVDVTAL